DFIKNCRVGSIIPSRNHNVRLNRKKARANAAVKSVHDAGDNDQRKNTDHGGEPTEARHAPHDRSRPLRKKIAVEKLNFNRPKDHKTSSSVSRSTNPTHAVCNDRRSQRVGKSRSLWGTQPGMYANFGTYARAK